MLKSSILSITSRGALWWSRTTAYHRALQGIRNSSHRDANDRYRQSASAVSCTSLHHSLAPSPIRLDCGHQSQRLTCRSHTLAHPFLRSQHTQQLVAKMTLTLESLPVELIAAIMEELNLQSLITVSVSLKIFAFQHA